MADSNHINPSDFLVKSKVKAILSEADMRISSDAWNDLGHQVTHAVKTAIRRAQANGRKTIRGCDF